MLEWLVQFAMPCTPYTLDKISRDRRWRFLGLAFDSGIGAFVNPGLGSGLGV